MARAGIAHVPEGRRLFPGLSVADDLKLGGCYRRNRDLTPVLTLFPALAGRLDQFAGSMSGGEQQMCALGRAMMSQPRFLLVDELSLGLAPLVVDEILAGLVRIGAARTGILLVEQDAAAALDVSNRGYVLENGAITLRGSAADPRVQRAYLGFACGSLAPGRLPHRRRSTYAAAMRVLLVEDDLRVAAAVQPSMRPEPTASAAVSGSSPSACRSTDGSSQASASSRPTTTAVAEPFGPIDSRRPRSPATSAIDRSRRTARWR